MNLIESLKWRYATKKMNGQSVPQDKVNQIIEAAQLAPTSSGLQPYRIICITNPELKQKIVPIAMGQSQIADCSHLLVFAAWERYTAERIEGNFLFTNKERGLPDDSASDYKNMLINNFTSQTPEQNFAHTARQAYIGFGIAIAAAAELRVDATPMEGFINSDLDELLDLRSRGLKSVSLLALGYRDEPNDWLVNLKKVRVPKEDFLIELN